MWATNSLWFETAIVLGIFAVGNILFGHFEQHNHPVVMTPWELDSIVTELGRELSEVDEAAAKELHRTLLPLRRGWREVAPWRGRPRVEAQVGRSPS